MECDGDNPDNHSKSEDLIDAFTLFEKHFGRVQKSIAKSAIHVNSDAYDMQNTSRGLCLIFNNKNFEKHTNLGVRNGTDVDAERLYHRFRELDFDVQMHADLTATKILDEITKAGMRNFTEEDCFVCCILSHGEEGVVYGKDSKISLDLIFAPFRGDVCPSLAGKPKLFFIQACQGDKLDAGLQIKHGERVQHDAVSSVYKIPTHADFLIAYSTVPGFYSWRNTTNGSWFIQGLCAVLEEHGQNLDILGLMTVVNRFVAYGFESHVPNDSYMDKKKQVPFVTSTLTRKVYFRPKF